LLLTLRWSEAICRNPNLALLSPYQRLLETIHAFELDVQATRAPLQGATFCAWSVDLAAGRAHPMASAVRIPSAP
jgi:hypothetical protein